MKKNKAQLASRTSSLDAASDTTDVTAPAAPHLHLLYNKLKHFPTLSFISSDIEL